MGVDIAQELQTIRSTEGGEAVKAAIRSALYKIAQSRGDVDIKKFTAGVMDEHRVGSYGNCAAGIDVKDYDTAQDDATNNGVANSRTVTLTVTEDSLLLAAVMHRVSADIVTLSGDGWTRVVTTEHYAKNPRTSDENSYQYISVWAKSVEPGEYTVTATYQQNKSYQLNLKLLALHGVSSVTKVADEQIPHFPYSAIAKNGKKRLYLTNNLNAYNDRLLTLAVITPLSGSLLETISIHGRFCIYYDDTINGNHREVFDYYFGAADYDQSHVNGTAACIVLDVD